MRIESESESSRKRAIMTSLSWTRRFSCSSHARTCPLIVPGSTGSRPKKRENPLQSTLSMTLEAALDTLLECKGHPATMNTLDFSSLDVGGSRRSKGREIVHMIMIFRLLRRGFRRIHAQTQGTFVPTMVCSPRLLSNVDSEAIIPAVHTHQTPTTP